MIQTGGLTNGRVFLCTYWSRELPPVMTSELDINSYHYDLMDFYIFGISTGCHHILPDVQTGPLLAFRGVPVSLG